MSASEITRTGPLRFTTTKWSDIFLAQTGNKKVSHEHLGQLIERYWRPIYLFIRQKGKSKEDAQDLAQQFYTEFLEKDVVSYADSSRGKFRTFLLASVTRFLALGHRSAARRPAEPHISGSDEVIERYAFEISDGETPEIVFERNWAKCTVENCVQRLRDECSVMRKELQFSVFQARYLRDPSENVSYQAIATEFGISETDVDHYLRWIKPRFRRILMEEVGVTTRSPDEVREEVRALLSCLS